MRDHLILLTTCLAFSLNSSLADDSGEHGSGERRRPPREAIEACSSKASGDACSFAGREKESVSGKCWSPKTDLPLACKPEGRGPKDSQRGPSRPSHADERQ